MKVLSSMAATLVELEHQLRHWVLESALPLWNSHGVDREGGGFFEELSTAPGTSVIQAAGEIRRGRVVARQLYVFDVGRRMGWQWEHADPLKHGCHYLFDHLYQGHGLFHTAIHAHSRLPQAPFSLYEYAFYLFALAKLQATQSQRFPVAPAALQCLRQLRGNWGRALGGFEESVPPSEPLKSNPHMHLLEAALAWMAACDQAQQAPWVELAQDLINLCLQRFIMPATGALLEYFDARWQPLGGEPGRIVEPGHQFEWAWLLVQWAGLPHCRAEQREVCLAAARRLVDIGERHGVDPVRGVAVNELWDDFQVKDAAAKLWPQTERLKAWCAMLTLAISEQEAHLATEKIIAAARTLQVYCAREPKGLWHEVMLADGSFAPGPSKASSLYHIVCAIETLHHTLALLPAHDLDR